MNVSMILIVIGALETILKEWVKGLEYLDIRGQMKNHPKYSIIYISQNSEKSHEDLGRLTLT